MPGSGHGLLLLDKPKGITSRGCVDAVSRVLGVRRAGHAGALDPMATGVLPVLLGKATRLSEYLMRTDKEYLFTAALGSRTDTGDAEGRVVEERVVPRLEADTVRSLLGEFTGEIEQVPPAYSAKKVEGRRAYAIARAGGTPKLSPVTIRVHQLELLDLQPPRLVLRAVCSHGTYVRRLCEDLGDKLGCGAHVSRLRRVRVGPFSEEDCVGLKDLSESEEPLVFLRSMGDIVSFMPSITVGEEEALALMHGKTVLVKSAEERPSEESAIVGSERALSEDERVRAVDRGGELVAICLRTGSSLEALKPEKVFVLSE